jgi:DNA-binding NarL/FixJ family response regulator
LHRQLDNKPDIAFCLINLAEQLRHLGDYPGANELLAEGIPLLRELGYKGTEGMGLNIHASLALAEGDNVRSASLALESTRLFAEVGDQLSIAENADLLAEICAARGDHVTAIELMASSATIRADLGSDPTPLKSRQLKALDRTIRQSISGADYERYWQAGIGHDLDTLVRRITIIAREIVGTQRPQPRFPVPDPPEVTHNLTNRELQILRLLTQGQSTREVSDTLFISPRTTTTHINNIFGKLEVSSRAAAVAHALRNNLV